MTVNVTIGNRLLSIQYLRGAAALAVVAYHALQWRGGLFDVGRAGVDVFFVISGVIMWSVTAGRATSPRAFLWRRFTRVAPAYWVATLAALAAALAWPDLLPQILPGVGHLALSLAFIPHFDPKGLPFPTLPPGWTLIYEAIFYGVFSVGLLAPEGRRAWLITGVLAAIVVAGFVLRNPVYMLGANPMLLQFAAGLWIAKAARAGALPGPAGGVGLITLGLCLFAVETLGDVFSELWRPFFWGVPAALIVAGALAVEGGGGVVRRRGLEALGDASYSIYLFHLPVVALMAHAMFHAPLAVFLPAALIASAAAGLVGRALVEKPLLALLRRPAAGQRDRSSPNHR